MNTIRPTNDVHAGAVSTETRVDEGPSALQTSSTTHTAQSSSTVASPPNDAATALNSLVDHGVHTLPFSPALRNSVAERLRQFLQSDPLVDALLHNADLASSTDSSPSKP